MKTTLIICVTVLFPLLSLAQTGGQHVFSFLDLSYNARESGLSDLFISVKDDDINVGVTNPGMLNSGMNNSVGVSQAFHAGGINYGMLAYGRSLKKDRFLSAHIRYVSYGKMQGTAVNGTTIGTFNPLEYIIGVGYNQKLNERIAVGANLNFIGSHLESYSSFGSSLDLGGVYTNEEGNWLVSALVKNAGVQFNPYYDERGTLPTNFLLGTSYKLRHAPFRFSLLAHHLNEWDLTYNDPTLQPTIDPLSGDTIPVKRPGFGEKLAQHLSYQLEILAGKNIHLRAGFNYYARQSLKLESKPGLAGFSFGTGLYFKRFNLDYGFTIYSKAGFNNMLTLTVNLDQIKK